MWAFRKEFDLRKASSVKARARAPSPAGCLAGEKDDSSNFITASKYVSIPLTNPAEDPLPSHWGERHAPIAEYFVTGTHDGAVSIVDVSGRNRMVRLVVHTHDNGARHENKSSKKDLEKSEGRNQRNAKKDDETKNSESNENNHDVENPLDACEVIALDVSGTIVASIAANDPRIIVSFLYPNAGDRIVEIQGPSFSSSSSTSHVNEGAFRSVMLWEGHPRWANQPDEERMLYVFVGTDNGAVLLYRVDVVERRYWLHSKFAVNVSGIDGAAAASGERNVSSRRFTNPIHSLALHDTNKKRAIYVAANPDIGAGGYHIYEEEKENAEKEGEDEEARLADKEDSGDIHLLGGTNNRWACWPLRFVPWGAHSRGATCREETQNSPESKTPRVADHHQRLLAARAAGSHSVVRKLSDEQLRGALVFIPYSPTEAKSIYMRVHSSREASSTSKPEDDKWRPKYDIVCGGAEIGTIMAVSRQTEKDSSGWDGGVNYQVEFPSLKKIVTWPSTLFDLVNTQTLFAKADSVGPIFSIAPLGPRRFVTGGADSLVKVWEWCGRGENENVRELSMAGASADAEREGAMGNNTFQPLREGVYKLLHRGGEGRGHSDLVKCVAPLRAPDVFISASYDGTIREWHIYDEPSVMLCRNTTLAIPNTTSASKEENGMGVATLSLVNGSRGLAVTGLFDLKVRTFAFMPVLGCELPDNMVFDGEKTRRIVLETTPASAPKSRDDAAHTSVLEPRDPHTEAISRYVSEIK